MTAPPLTRPAAAAVAAQRRPPAAAPVAPVPPAVRRVPQWTAGPAVVAAVVVGGLGFGPVFGYRVLLPVVLLAAAGVASADAVALRLPALAVLRPVLGAGLGLLAVAGWTRSGPDLLLAAARHGWRRTLDTTWPVGERPELLFVPLLVLLAAVLAVELLRRTGPVPALLPGLAVLTVAQAYHPAGDLAVPLAAGWAVTALLALARVTALLALARGAAVRLLAGAAALLVVAAPAALAAARFSVTGRPATTLDGSAAPLPVRAANPLDELAGRLADGDRVAFEVRTDAPVDRWTVVVLDAFDGAAWTSAARYRRLGGTLPADPAVTAARLPGSATVTVHDVPGPWLPSRNRTTAVTGTVGAAVRVDPATGVLLADRPATAYTLHWTAPDLAAADLPGAAVDPVLGGPMPLGVVPGALRTFAREATGGEPPSVRTALRLEAFLRDNYRIATRPPLPTGHSYAQLGYFLGTSRRGTSEQFATAYVVLARLAGIPARLVVGFRQPAGSGTVRNRDMLAWPEIAVAGYGWVPLDPTSSIAGAEGRPALPDTPDTRPAPSTGPPINAPTPPPPAPAAAPPAPGPPGPPAAALAALTATALALLAAVPATKGVRGHRRRRGDPVTSVAGAWAEARDRLRDHGLRAGPAGTPRDLARVAGADVRAGLDRLATCVDLARWSGRPVDPQVGAEAWRAVAAIRTALRRRSPGRRLRATFSPGSLFRRSAGPG